MAIGKTLTVYLAADVDKLRKGLRDADDGFKIFGHSLNSMVGPALIGATAAAGAFAVKLGVDAVQSAMQEEQELAKLSTTLDNLGFGNQSEKVNKFIDDLQYSAAVTDSELRPAFDRLVRSTGSITEAQNALTLALDVSAGTGKSLEAVSNALGKAYDGNTGALGKLGAGIDAATLKSGDMNAINERLTLTFKGQSDAAADTAQGGMKKLQIAADELIEAFGTGLVGAADASSQAIDDAVQSMRDLQPAAQNVGEEVSSTGQAWLKAADYFLLAVDAASSNKWGLATQLIFGSGDALVQAGKEARGLGKQFEYVQYAAYQAAATMNDAFAFGGAETGGTPTQAYNGLNAMNNMLARMQDRLKKTKEAAGGTGGSGGLSGAIEKMNPRLRAQIDLVKELTTKVGDAGKALEAARDDMNAWIDSMASNILSGINLGTIQQFDEEGKRTGQSLLEGFNKQIEQAGLFGSYLKQLNSEGGPELRDAVAALGPEAGNKLAKEIIDQGLIPTMQSKLVDVQSMAETTAAEMVPPMLVAGVQSAAGYLMTMQAELEESSSLLEEMGRQMGKTLSEAMVKEIRDALAAAGVAQGGATSVMAGTAGTAAQAASQANLIAGSPFLNGTAIMQAIQNAIQQSDQRLGRTGQVLNS
jgi:hypothetical protein